MKRLLSALLCAAVVLGAVHIVPASAVDTNVTLRVGLTIDGASSFADPKLENVSGEPTGYSIGTMNGTSFSGGTAISASQLTIRLVNDAFQVSDTSTGAVLYTSAAGADHIAIRPNSALTWFRGYQWHGDFVYRPAGGGNITVMNYVALEDYVKGVLPYEIDPDWPAEAQKAQAVCARSFALGTSKHNEYFELCNTTNCQVYLGTNRATTASDAAVDATRGQYLVYAGEPVIGYFFSSDGGATEDAVNVWGGDYPYLQGKEDPYETHDSSWSVTLTADEIRQMLLDAGYEIGSVDNVMVTRRTETDNVNEVTVTDTNGKTVVLQRDDCRTVFGLKSIRYTITPNGAQRSPVAVQRTSPNAVPSSHNVTVDGLSVMPQGYNIGGNNFYKLRDIAYILSGTDSQFNVSWEAETDRILIASGVPYQAVGGEMSSAASTQINSFLTSDAVVVIDGRTVSLTGYRINGNNYFMLRDIGVALDFGVDFDEATRTVLIDSAASSTDEPPQMSGATSYTFAGSGWGHSVGMSQWGAYGMAQQGFNYEEILKFYFTGIEIGR